jgi:peptide/nickel transport system substrate-binding protein
MRKTLLLAAIASLAVSTALTPAAFAQARTDVKIGLVLEPPSLDPTAEAAAAVDEVVYANVFEGLTRFAPDGTVIPALAKSWDISEDGLTYTFSLVEGATFHDGTSFDAEDVKFSLERINAEGSLNAQKQLYADIASVEVVDPATVKVTLAKPNGDFIYNLAWGDAVIVAPESAETNKTMPVGTGPFVFANRIEGDSITLGKNESYWGTPVALEGATFRFIADPTAAFGAMQAGDVDAFPNFPAAETIAQFENDPRFKVVVGSTQGETILAMNNGRIEDVKVRQAIAHALNREDIINGAMSGFGIPIGTFFPPGDANYVDLTGQSNFDPEKSKALLAEAGVSDLTLSLKLPPVEGYARRGGEIIAQQLAAVGIKTETTNLEWAQWLDEVFKQKNYDLTIISHTEPNDISIFSRPDYYFDYQSEAFNQIIADLSVTADQAKRAELLKAAQQQLADDYVVGFLFMLPKIGVQAANLEGLWENAPAQATDLTAVRWTE